MRVISVLPVTEPAQSDLDRAAAQAHPGLSGRPCPGGEVGRCGRLPGSTGRGPRRFQQIRFGDRGRDRPHPRPRAGKSDKSGTGTGTGSGVSARPARNYAAQWQIEGRSGFRQGPAQAQRLAFTRDPHAPHVSAIRPRPSESGTLPCSVTAECAHESAMRRIRASVPCRNPNERLRAIACSSRRSTYRLLLRFAASGSSAASYRPAALPRSPWLQPARSRPPLAFISSSKWTARSSFLRWPCFDRVCRAVPRA